MHCSSVLFKTLSSSFYCWERVALGVSVLSVCQNAKSTQFKYPCWYYWYYSHSGLWVLVLYTFHWYKCIVDTSGGIWLTFCQEFAGFILTHSLTCSGRDFLAIAQGKIYFSSSILPFIGRFNPHTLYIWSLTWPLSQDKPHWNLWFLTAEVSCIIGSSCSWVTSTDSFGKPDWVLSSIGVLASQERQQMLLENSSSHADAAGRQSCSAPGLDPAFTQLSGQQESAGPWKCHHVLGLVKSSQRHSQCPRARDNHAIQVCCLGVYGCTL